MEPYQQRQHVLLGNLGSLIDTETWGKSDPLHSEWKTSKPISDLKVQNSFPFCEEFKPKQEQSEIKKKRTSDQRRLDLTLSEVGGSGRGHDDFLENI